MKRILLIASIAVLTTFTACSRYKYEYDASGTFEATEIIISPEVSGTLKLFTIEEGQQLDSGVRVGYIDSVQLYLKKMQLISSRKAVQASRPDMNKQIEATREEIARAKTEKTRIENLFAGAAATRQQLDEITATLKVAEGKLAAQMNSLQSNIGSLNEQSSTIDIQIAQIDDQLAKCRIINPIKGTVLQKYAQEFEVCSPAKALYKIADIETLYLRAYLTSEQLSKVKLGQEVKVFTDAADSGNHEYTGQITWVSDKAEFTPKTIQTKDERANLVYAVKIAVKNDGYLKIGMYGDVKLVSSIK